MKALVAVTCIAILAVIFYFFWGEYRQRQAAEAAQGERALRSTCLSDDIHRLPQVRSHCLDLGYPVKK